MQQLELSAVKTWKGNCAIVEVLDPQDKTKAGLYVPENYAKPNGDDDKLWRGKIVQFGEDADEAIIKHEELSKGTVVWLRPISLHCPSFKDGKGKEYVKVALDDIFAKEDEVIY